MSREIESEQDILDLLSEHTLAMYNKLSEVYQNHALNLLGQRLDWCTADQKEIDKALKWIIRIEL